MDQALTRPARLKALHDALAKRILEGGFGPKDTIAIGVRKGALVFDKGAPEAASA